MSLLFRRILLLLSIIIFAAITPLVVLYAIGYRPPSGKNSSNFASQIGVLLVDALPRGAEVHVNDQNKGRVPQSVPNLQPGVIDVKITKEGYIPWEKTLEIFPAKATEVRSTRLIPENIEIQQILQNVHTFSLSPSRSRAQIITRDAKLVVMDVLEQEVFVEIQLTAIPESVLWSPDSASLLMRYTNGTFEVVDVNTDSAPRVVLRPLQGARDVVWNPRLSGRLVGIQKGSLVSFNVADQTITPLIEHITSFGLSDRNIFAAMADGKTLMQYSLQGENGKVVSAALLSPVQEIQVAPAGNVALVLRDGTAWYVTDDNMLEQIAQYVSHVAWSPDGQMLMVYTSRNELYVFNVENERQYHIPLKQLQLVVRLSRQLLHPQWFAGGNHFIYQVDDEIVITEIDTRDHSISHVIDTTNTGSAKLTVGEDGNTVYYLKQSDKGTALSVAHLLISADR